MVIARRPDEVAPAGSDLGAIRDRLLEMTRGLADLFDARNGNAHFRKKLADFVAVLALGRPHPLPRSSSTGGKAEKFLGDSKY